MIQQWLVQKAISENILAYERSYKEKNQTDLYPAEFTGELLRILSAIRVQQRRKKDQSSEDLRKIIPRLFLN